MMCIICVELEKDKLTSKEARRNLGEFREILEQEHKLEVLRNIWKKEDEEFLKEDLVTEDTIKAYRKAIDSWESYGNSGSD
tara:strand:- start:247 stop:489 length:243 start_codon:yes stop_codon:yes gene_type:complete